MKKVLFLIYISLLFDICFSQYLTNDKIHQSNIIYWNKNDQLKLYLDNYNYRIYFSNSYTNYLFNNLYLETNTNNLYYYSITNINNFKHITNSFYLSCISVNNSNTINYLVIVDQSRPIVNIITKSYSINYGGSSFVIYQVIDSNLVDNYIIDNNNNRINSYNFLSNFYISIVPFSLYNKDGNFKIVAVDKAGNIANYNINFKEVEKKYKVYKIQLSENVINDKNKELGIDKTNFSSIHENYTAILNEMNKQKKVDIIKETKKINNENFLKFPIKIYPPLKNYRITSDYGVKRLFYLRDKKVRESIHFGIDLVSEKNAPIQSILDGRVIFSDYNGASGNVVLIHHGFGLYSVYMHCSRLFVKSGDIVKQGQIIAEIGSTGYSVGEHLHFGIIVNGISVNPNEWLDQDWIDENINNLILNFITNKNNI